jgi:hypothetical protein
MSAAGSAALAFCGGLATKAIAAIARSLRTCKEKLAEFSFFILPPLPLFEI